MIVFFTVLILVLILSWIFFSEDILYEIDRYLHPPKCEDCEYYKPKILSDSFLEAFPEHIDSRTELAKCDLSKRGMQYADLEREHGECGAYGKNFKEKE